MKPVSKTAYYCCGVRMQDAESQHPIIGDTYARRLLGQEGLAYWESFREFKRPNAGNTVRHYLIDQHVRSVLAQEPDTSIFVIGAGLDSRAYRLGSGNWFEFDEPAIIEYKNRVLPIEECSNSLQRISIDFSREKLMDRLQPLTETKQVIVIVEGVIMYLSNQQTLEMIQTLQNTFPHHTLLVDLMTKKFFKIFSKKIHHKIVSSGTRFQDLDNHPNRLFLEHGYQQLEVISTVKTAVNLGLVKIPKFVVNHLLANLMMGYSVYKFRYRRN